MSVYSWALFHKTFAIATNPLFSDKSGFQRQICHQRQVFHFIKILSLKVQRHLFAIATNFVAAQGVATKFVIECVIMSNIAILSGIKSPYILIGTMFLKMSDCLQLQIFSKLLLCTYLFVYKHACMTYLSWQHYTCSHIHHNSWLQLYIYTHTKKRVYRGKYWVVIAFNVINLLLITADLCQLHVNANDRFIYRYRKSPLKMSFPNRNPSFGVHRKKKRGWYIIAGTGAMHEDTEAIY